MVNPYDVTKEQFLAEIRAVGEDLRAGRIPANIHFDMSAVRERADDWGIKECGTVCCIGGWAELRLGVSARDAGLLMARWTSYLDKTNYDEALYALFFDYTSHTDVEEAVRAIDHYFAGESQPWRDD